MRPSSRISVPYVAYVLLLMAFASLGIFVATLASGSPLAAVAGVAVVACLGGAVAGFRVRARELTQAKNSGDQASNVSIFSIPLRQDQIDRYLENYRAQGDTVHEGRMMTVAPDGQSLEHDSWSQNEREHATAAFAHPLSA